MGVATLFAHSLLINCCVLLLTKTLDWLTEVVKQLRDLSKTVKDLDTNMSKSVKILEMKQTDLSSTLKDITTDQTDVSS